MKSLHKERLGKVRTKIVATIGPASSDPVIMSQMVEAGVDVFRLNFSHGTHEVHTAALEAIRRIAAETGIQLAVLQDLCGPKIRLGEIAGGVVVCDHDAEFVLVGRAGSGDDPHHLTSTYRALADDLEVGPERAFRRRHGRDGRGRPRPGLGAAQGHAAGPIRSNQGINVPAGGLERGGAHREGPGRPRLDRDARGRLRRALVRADGGGHRALRGELERRGSRARIVAKIEKPQALANLDAIVAEADAVMVARGDLGVELDVTRVPAIQKQIIDACHRRGCR